MEAGEIDSGFWYQGRQADNEVQRLEDDMGGAVAKLCLECIAHPASGREWQALLGDGRSCHVAAQPFHLVSLLGAVGHPGVQAEAVQFGHTGVVGRGFRGRWDRLQAEHLAAPLGANGDPVGDRVSVNVLAWVGL